MAQLSIQQTLGVFRCMNLWSVAQSPSALTTRKLVRGDSLIRKYGPSTWPCKEKNFADKIVNPSPAIQSRITKTNATVNNMARFHHLIVTNLALFERWVHMLSTKYKWFSSYEAVCDDDRQSLLKGYLPLSVCNVWHEKGVDCWHDRVTGLLRDMWKQSAALCPPCTWTRLMRRPCHWRAVSFLGGASNSCWTGQ